MSTARGRLGTAARRFAGDAAGLGAIEFAFVVPFLLVLYLGVVDATRYVSFRQRLQEATTTINDLVAQESSLTRAGVEERTKVADAMLSDYDRSRFKVRVSSIRIESDGVARPICSFAKNMARLRLNVPYQLPANMSELRNVTVIMTETADVYAPLSASLFTTAAPVTAQTVGSSRGSSSITCPDQWS
jgi:Flp pilus assembly protein TadG